MDKIWVLFLCFNFAWCKLHEGKAQRRCNDCVPITMCKEATPYLNLSEENLQTVNKFYCGIKNGIFQVCCSKLKDTVGDISGLHPNLKLLPDDCGNVYNGLDARIFGGVESQLFEFPWAVLISYKPDLNFKCSGSLINSRYVLTAAHCVHNADIAGVRVGEHKIGSDVDCTDGVCVNAHQDLRVKDIIPHEDYNKFDNHVNDIALIRLKDKANMSLPNAGTVCLPITEELKKRTITSRFATVVGWGKTELEDESSLLLKVNVEVRSNRYCHTYYRHISPSDKQRFCAGGKNQDSCKGDSGGPLMIQDTYKGDNKYIQYGIVSYGGVQCGVQNAPGVYTNVRNYVKWILDNIRE